MTTSSRRTAACRMFAGGAAQGQTIGWVCAAGDFAPFIHRAKQKWSERIHGLKSVPK